VVLRRPGRAAVGAKRDLDTFVQHVGERLTSSNPGSTVSHEGVIRARLAMARPAPSALGAWRWLLLHRTSVWQWRLVLLVSALAAINLVNNLVLHADAYVPANLVFAAGAVLIARRTGMSWDDLGLSRERLRRGIGVGLVAAGIVTSVLAAFAYVPVLADHFRAAGTPGTEEVAWSVLVRIPFGTALPEELLFRSVLLGVLLTRLRPVRAALASAGLFGLWHVLPTLDGASAFSGGAPEVALAVLATTAAGAGFAWLRVHADSVLAPVAAHAAINGIALLVSHLLVVGG
jgi:membrane protease YdiL (CAAX protease family)